MPFKDKIKQLRKENNLSQQELAKSIFVSRSAICKWEMGNGVPSEVNIESICDFFKVDKEWLFDEIDKNETVQIIQKNKHSNILNIMLIVMNIIFLIIILGLLNKSIVVGSVKEPIMLWKLFNVFELLIIFASTFLSLSIGVGLILNNNGFLVLNITDEKRRRISGFSFVISIGIFCLFLIYFLVRNGNSEDYYKVINAEIIIQDAILVSSVLLIILFFALSTRKLAIVEIIISIINYVVFIIAVFWFAYCLGNSSIFQEDQKSIGVIVGFLLNSLFGLVSIILSIICITFGIKAKLKNKVLLIINSLIIILCIAMFVFIILIL